MVKNNGSVQKSSAKCLTKKPEAHKNILFNINTFTLMISRSAFIHRKKCEERNRETEGNSHKESTK